MIDRRLYVNDDDHDPGNLMIIVSDDNDYDYDMKGHGYYYRFASDMSWVQVGEDESSKVILSLFFLIVIVNTFYNSHDHSLLIVNIR